MQWRRQQEAQLRCLVRLGLQRRCLQSWHTAWLRQVLTPFSVYILVSADVSDSLVDTGWPATWEGWTCLLETAIQLSICVMKSVYKPLLRADDAGRSGKRGNTSPSLFTPAIQHGSLARSC